MHIKCKHVGTVVLYISMSGCTIQAGRFEMLKSELGVELILVYFKVTVLIPIIIS